MPLLPKIETHLNNIDKAKASIKTDIEDIFNKINPSNFVADPGPIIDVIIFAITQRITKKYIRPMLTEAKRYTKDVLSTKGEQEL